MRNQSHTSTFAVSITSRKKAGTDAKSVSAFYSFKGYLPCLNRGLFALNLLQRGFLFLNCLIGDAAGKNWWCVVFPPLCTTAAADVPAAALSAGLSEDEVALITEADEGYVLKFKTVELWEKLKARLAE